MQYQQKRKERKKKKRRKECSPQRNGKKTMTCFSIKATFSVQRPGKTKQTKRGMKRERGAKKNPHEN